MWAGVAAVSVTQYSVAKLKISSDVSQSSHYRLKIISFGTSGTSRLDAV